MQLLIIIVTLLAMAVACHGQTVAGLFLKYDLLPPINTTNYPSYSSIPPLDLCRFGLTTNGHTITNFCEIEYSTNLVAGSWHDSQVRTAGCAVALWLTNGTMQLASGCCHVFITNCLPPVFFRLRIIP
jgi:hypothetical protein